ncbi:MAG: hypothetical protein RR668_06405, partial [Algoriella sp.]
LFLFNCFSIKEEKCKNSINNMLDYYLEKYDIENNEILLKYDIVPWEPNYYLITITAINKDVYFSVGDYSKDFGRYTYKNNSISIFSSNKISITPQLKNFNKYSDKSYSNVNGMIINYDPDMLSFYVDKKRFFYIKTFSESKIMNTIPNQNLQ